MKTMNEKNTKIRKSKILYLTVQWLKLTFSELKRKIKFINNKDDIFSKKIFNFFLSKRFYILYIYL